MSCLRGQYHKNCTDCQKNMPWGCGWFSTQQIGLLLKFARSDSSVLPSLSAWQATRQALERKGIIVDDGKSCRLTPLGRKIVGAAVRMAQ